MTSLNSNAFVFFGATGDLASKQIFPALQAMIKRGHFDMPIIGVARSAKSVDGLLARARESLEKHGGVDALAFATLSARLQYVNGDVTATEVLVELKRSPQAVFDTVNQSQANYFRFRLSPNVAISLGARVKVPGEAMVGESVELVVRPESTDQMTPYERLLGDAIRGDATLFVRESGVEAGWSVVDPILRNAPPVHEYEPNTWGPTEADQIIAGDGGWHNPKPIGEKALTAAK
jgi:glucose-6-phosphate 1-dehydrogenase